MEFEVAFQELEQKLKARKASQTVEEMSFIVALCNDVFVDALKYGKRRELVILEPVGRRIQHIINETFDGTPYLLLDIEFWLSFSLCFSN